METTTLDITLFKVVVAPEYARMKDAEINAFANVTRNEISEQKFGKFYQQAWANLTAHLIFMSRRDSEETGILESMRVGQVEKRYNNFEKMGQDPNYLVSKYGREFVRLRRFIIRGPVVLGDGDFPPPAA